MRGRFGFLHDFTIWEGFNKVRISRLNPIGSFADLRINWSMANHCETTTLIVLIILNKLDLANVCLKRFVDRRTSLIQLTSGSEVFKKKWQSTHLSGISGISAIGRDFET